jgi:hypothetical protein
MVSRNVAGVGVTKSGSAAFVIPSPFHRQSQTSDPTNIFPTIYRAPFASASSALTRPLLKV